MAPIKFAAGVESTSGAWHEVMRLKRNVDGPLLKSSSNAK
jgi:hypothetical protein